MKLKSKHKFDQHLETTRIGRHICFGGGGQAPSQTTVNNSSLPAYLQPYVESNIAAAEGEVNKPYQAYGGQRIAGFNANQMGTQANVMGMQQPGQFGAASDMMGNMDVGGAFAPGQNNLNTAGSNIQGIQQPGQYGVATQATLGGMNTNWADPNVSQAYMNPYQQNVTDIAKREASRQGDIQQTADSARFAKAGAFGGSRQGIVDAERNLGQQQNDIQMQGSNQAYQQGMGQFNADRSSLMGGANQLANIGGQQLQGQLAQQQALAGVGAQQVGAAGAQTAAQQAQAAGLASLGSQQQQADLNRYGAQGQVGAQQQAQTQQGLSQDYQDFINQRDYGKQQVGWMNSMLHGTPAATDTSQQVYTPPPNVAGQVAGLGIAGVGAYNASQQPAK